MKVHAPFLKNLLDFASFQNVNTTFLRSFMANPEVDLNDPEEMIAASDYVNILDTIIDKAKTASCGLSIGAFFNLRSLGLVLEISLNTSSLKQGILILEKFLEGKFPLVSFTIIKKSDCYALSFESSVDNKKVKRELLNMVMYVVYRELKLMLPNKQAPQIQFPFTTNEETSLYFNEMVIYDANHTVILPKNLDALEINLNRVKEIELLLPKFVSMLQQRTHTSKKFAKQVKDMTLNMCNPEIPSLKQVQRQFACSERTFQRRLTAEGTSFRKIVNEIKEELSGYLLNEKHLGTKDIAYILGYSESSAYLHALKAWKNKPKMAPLR